MTVTYTAEVATCKGFGCFGKLLFRWRGSIYKLVWPDLMMFLVFYYSLNFSYRFLMDATQKAAFEAVVQYCETFNDLIPLSFVLGFYVSIVMTRWWDQYTTIPWPDPIAVFVSTNVHGQDERGRVMRRTVMRYVCLCLTMVFTMISPRVKKRFPTLDHFVEAGLLTDNEKTIMTDLNEKFPRHSKHWLPIVWAASIVTRARKEGRVRDDFAVKTIIDEINKFRGKCGLLLSYDTISVPLVYTQVVTLACYSYFITCILSRQWLDIKSDGPPSLLHKHKNSIDLYFPIFTTLQFFFYMGWLKVAESLINPFGEDDDDFEVNWLVDRNLQVSYLIVDEMHHEHPELIKDQYWDEVFPSQLPHTIASEPYRDQQPQHSTANIEVSKVDAEPALMSEKGDDGDHLFGEDGLSGIHFNTGSKRSISRLSGRDRLSGGSNSSINTNPVGSLASTIHRVGSVTSVLRRLFSREGQPANNSPTAAMTDGMLMTMGGGGGGERTGGSRLSTSNSSSSLHSKFVGGGSMRIADQVIEEVDEQATITSMRPPDNHPSVRMIFPGHTGPPPPSAPVAVPSSLNTHSPMDMMPPMSFSAPATASLAIATPSPTSSNTTFTENLSVKSAPGFSPGVGATKAERERGSNNAIDAGDNVSIGSSTGDEDDEFTRLKSLREKERNERYMQRLARSISAQQGAFNADNEELLMDLTVNSATGLLTPSPRQTKYTDEPV